MRKQELIHLHLLLKEVRTYCSPEADFAEYESLEVNASSVYHRKEAHHEALFVLAESITYDLGDERPAVGQATSVKSGVGYPSQ